LSNENLILNIYNSFGSLVQQIHIKINQEKIMLNLTKELKGLYHITLGNKEKIYTGTIINI